MEQIKVAIFGICFMGRLYTEPWRPLGMCKSPHSCDVRLVGWVGARSDASAAHPRNLTRSDLKLWDMNQRNKTIVFWLLIFGFLIALHELARHWQPYSYP
jgi:hypothetical protein